MDDNSIQDELYHQLSDRWFSTSAIVANSIAQVNHSLQEVNTIHNILLEIGKSGAVTAAELKEYTAAAFANAGKYNLSVRSYLENLSALAAADFADTKGLANLSAMAQTAGSLDAELANQYLLAADAAFAYFGSTEKLNALLDSQFQISRRNRLSMSELAQATKAAAGQLSDTVAAENKLTAFLGTGIAAGGKSGEAVGNGIADILNNLQALEDKDWAVSLLGRDTVDKIESRCRTLGIALYEVKNGITALRDPMTILEEIGQAFQALPHDSPLPADLTAALGGIENADLLTGIFSQWDTYQKLLGDYQNATGAAFEAASLSTDSLDGALNRLSNTWTAMVSNIGASDGLTTGISGLNHLLGAVNSAISTLGPAGSLGAVLGLLASKKNVGKQLLVSLYACLKYENAPCCKALA